MSKFNQCFLLLRIGILMLIFSTVLSIPNYAQASSGDMRVTLHLKNTPLKKVFSEITRQTKLYFMGNSDKLNQNERYTIKAENETVNNVLTQLLRGKGFSWTIKDNTVLIQKSSENISTKRTGFSDATLDSTIAVSGKIINEKGDPIPGATVIIKGTQLGTTTDSDGTFKISGVKANAAVVITNVAYLTKEFLLRGKGNIGTIQLEDYVSILDETQIIAYGITSRRLNTGNVSSVKASDIQKQPVNNPLLALQGRVPGVFIEQSTGLPGSGVKVKIQGINSISRGSDPLYVIDGVPYASQLLPSIGASLDGNGSPMSFINPNDIESIDVLKDGDATSIYGSRGANGAILITTKKGKSGKTRFDINAQNGWGTISHKLNLLHTQEYLQVRKQAFANDNINLNAAPYNNPNFKAVLLPDLAIWDQNAYTDWQKALIGNTAGYQDLNATISGGGANTTFLVGGTYHKETTTFPTNYGDTKGSLHFNFNNNSNDQKFKLQLSGSYLVDNNRLPGVPDLTRTALTLSPNAPSLRNFDGTLNWEPYNVGNTIASTWINPLAQLNQKFNIKTNNLISSAVLSYEIVSGLIIKSNLGYTYLQSNAIQTTPSSVQKPEERPFIDRTSLFQYNNINSWIAEPQLNYKSIIGNGTVDVLIGATFQNNSANGLKLEAKGFNSDLVMEDIRSATSVTPTQDQGTTIATYRYNALFSRIAYNYQDKYLVNLSARRDGSSRFGSQNRFHNFGSLAAAWVFSSESFIRDNVSLITFGKFKMSYGTTGNDQIGDYQFLSLYSPTSADLAYQGSNGLQIDGLPNPYLQWEVTKKFSLGVDLGFWSDRILLNVNYNRNRSSNQLVSSPLANTTGFGSITANLPATVQNTGWEFSVNSTNIKTKDFDWNSSFNITLPKNKLLSFPDLANSGYTDILIVGESINISKVYHFLGVNPQTGLYEYSTKDGSSSTSSPNFSADRISVLKSRENQDFYGGFQNSFRYKGLSLDVLFSFVKQRGQSYYYGTTSVGQKFNQPISVLDAWQKSGDIASVQRYASGRVPANSRPAQTLVQSDALDSDASYIRLKNISLSWQLPEKVVNKIRLQKARLYIQGQNLLTVTNYQGLDPENRSSSFLPPLRIITTGIQISF